MNKKIILALIFFAILLSYIFVTSNFEATLFCALTLGMPAFLIWFCYKLDKHLNN
jgi:hypothetical protein